jgi:hypothetical protein
MESWDLSRDPATISSGAVMKILIAEYASALSLGGTVELEGQAMLAALVKSFAQSGNDVVYLTAGPKLDDIERDLCFGRRICGYDMAQNG